MCAPHWVSSLRLVVVTIAAFALVTGCGGGKEPTQNREADADQPQAATNKDEGPTTIDVSLLERAISARPSKVKAGKVSFNVSNLGGTKHELVVIRTELAATDLPVLDNGAVNEKGKDLKVIGELRDVQPTQSGELSVKLKPGDHVLICNVVTDLGGGETFVHYKEGMRSPLTVE